MRKNFRFVVCATCLKSRKVAIMLGARLAPSERKRIEDAYQNNRRVYGSPRLHAELKEQGVHCGRKRVARLMRERGINVKPRRRKMKTTDSNHGNPVAPKR